MKKVIILDFESGSVLVSDYDPIYEDFTDFIIDFNEKNNMKLRESNLQWMIIDKQIDITFI